MRSARFIPAGKSRRPPARKPKREVAKQVPPARARTRPRRIGVARLGMQWLRHLLAHGRLWSRLWLAPEPWPQPPPGLAIEVHGEAA